jgi:hypothetical protein
MRENPMHDGFDAAAEQTSGVGGSEFVSRSSARVERPSRAPAHAYRLLRAYDPGGYASSQMILNRAANGSSGGSPDDRAVARCRG